MEILLEGKSVAENVKKRIEKEKNKNQKQPFIAVLGIDGDEASKTYINRIEKNCQKYGIKFLLKLAKNEEEFRKNFNLVKNDPNITGIMFQQPLPKEISNLINEISYKKDVEGIGNINMGKLFIGENDVNIPCTSRAVIETLNFYNIYFIFIQ